jgi:hypothetical protein
MRTAQMHRQGAGVIMATATRTMRAWAAVALLALCAAPAAAQDGVLYGRVTSEDGVPLSGAEVRVSVLNAAVRTDANGQFRIPGVPSGLYYFGVRQVGFHPAADLLRFSNGDTLDIVLEPVEATKKLDTVTVQARADAAWERDLRRYAAALEAARFGTVFTEQDIRDRNPIWTSDLFQTQAGFRVVGGGGSAVVYGSRSNCLPGIFVDGQLVRGMRVNDITPTFIKLMVIYRSVANVPPQYQDARVNSNCGTILLFTL